LAITSVRTRKNEAIPALARLAHDPDAAVRYHAVVALGTMERSGDAAAVPELIGALSDNVLESEDGRTYHFETRQNAARVLGEIGPDGRASIPMLKVLLSDPDSSARLEAAIALWRLDRDSRVLSVLIQDIKSARRTETCVRVIRAFGEMGPLAKDAIPVIVRTANAPPLEPMIPAVTIREAAMDAVDKIDPKQWHLLLPPSNGRRFFDDMEQPPVLDVEHPGTPRSRSRPRSDLSP
jgi:HEAT repeat protein